MQRRDFNVLAGLAGLLGTGLAPSAFAQGGAPVEGQQYRRLPQPLPTTAGKIELIEFFWYGCPHCFIFDPSLNQWLHTLPADVAFRRVHVGFGAIHKLHQRLFYALEAMGKEAEVHERVFAAFHIERVDVSDDDAVFALVSRLGLNLAQFKTAYASFGVQSKCMQATRLSNDYLIDGVPTLGVAGRFITSPSMAGKQGQNERELGVQALAVADRLIQLARNK
jgi:thiol:disulfide interchange protein DsbA